MAPNIPGVRNNLEGGASQTRHSTHVNLGRRRASGQLQEARQKISLLAAKLDRIPGVPGELHTPLKQRILDDPDSVLDDALAQLRGFANTKRDMISFGTDILGRLCEPGIGPRFSKEVLRPASRRTLTSAEAWKRSQEVLNIDALRAAGMRAPNWTIGIGRGAELAAVFGVEGTVGLGGILQQSAFYYLCSTGAVGSSALVEMGFEVVFSPGPPSNFSGGSLGIEIGGTYKIGLSVGVSVRLNAVGRLMFPALCGPLRWEDVESIKVGLPMLGAGAEGSVTISQTEVVFLAGVTRS